MKEQDKIELISNLYHQGKLEAMQLNDIDKPTKTYDIMIFMDITKPNKDGFTDYIYLDYLYGSTEFNNQLGYGGYNACLANYQFIYEALKRNKLLKGDK